MGRPTGVGRVRPNGIADRRVARLGVERGCVNRSRTGTTSGIGRGISPSIGIQRGIGIGPSIQRGVGSGIGIGIERDIGRSAVRGRI